MEQVQEELFVSIILIYTIKQNFLEGGADLQLHLMSQKILIKDLILKFQG